METHPSQNADGAGLPTPPTLMNTGDPSATEPLPSTEPMQAFCYPVTGDAVRIVVRDGEPWLVARDVCRVLEIGNPTMALKRLDEDEKMTLNTIEGHSRQRGGPQFFNIVNESGFYALIMTSRKPQAKAFRKWVTGEILPTIRKTGRYEAAHALPSPEDLLQRAMAGVLDGSVTTEQAEAIRGLYRARLGEPEERPLRGRSIRNRTFFNGQAIDAGHPWVQVIVGLAQGGPWEGTMEQLAAIVTAEASVTDARQLGRFIGAARTVLEALGLTVSDRVQIRTQFGAREYRRRIELRTNEVGLAS